MALSKADFNNINVTPAASKKLKWNASANGFETGDVGGSMVLLSTATASSSANLTFDSSIDSTYKEYIFKFTDVHPATDSAQFLVNFRDGGSNYDATKTTTHFAASHSEDDSEAQIAYDTGRDLAQSTSGQNISNEVGNANHECGAGFLHLFDPSNTTFVKHFICTTNFHHASDLSLNNYVAGYCNVTAAIDGVQFSFSSGNIDAGTIKMYGIL